MADVDTLKAVIDLSNQPILIAFDVKYRPFIYGVSGGKRFPNVGQCLPGSSLRNAKPNVKRPFQIVVSHGCFLELLAADDVQACSFSWFAYCEVHCSSQNAKLSRVCKHQKQQHFAPWIFADERGLTAPSMAFRTRLLQSRSDR